MQKKRLLFFLELNVDAEKETAIFLGAKCGYRKRLFFERESCADIELSV